MASDLPALMTVAAQGDRSAAEALFTALYDELHRVARRELARSGPRVTLGATSLLHQAYLGIAGQEGVAFPDRNRFMAYAARVMRRLVIDYVRRKQAHKRGGQFEITSLADDAADAPAQALALQHLSDALDELAALEPALADVVDLKFFCGFAFAEIAAMQGTSERTVQRDWQKARLYLHRVLSGHDPMEPDDGGGGS